MGMFDWVNVPCPRCGLVVGFRSHGGDCILAEYTLANCPPDVLIGVNRRAPAECKHCGTQFAVRVTWCAESVAIDDDEE